MVWIRSILILATSIAFAYGQNTTVEQSTTTPLADNNATAEIDFGFDPNFLANLANIPDPWKRPALNISAFDQISSEKIIDAWKKMSNSDLIDGQKFSIAVINDTIYLVSSRRLARNDSNLPELASVRGGVVSSFHKPSNTWIHKSYDRLADDQYEDYLFSVQNRLFMLIALEENQTMSYHDLLYWDVDKAEWIHVPIDIDNSTVLDLERGQKFEKFVNLNVPDPDGYSVFITATDHDLGNTDAVTMFSKLDIEFNETIPIRASLNKITKVQTQLATAILSTAIVDNVMYAVVGHFKQDSDEAQVSIDFIIDFNTGEASFVTFIGGIPTVSPTGYKQDRIFQIRNQLLFLGPHKASMDEQNQRHIWLLELIAFNQLIWRETDGVFPDMPFRTFAIDQTNADIVTADLEKGVFISHINA